jgi:hypothetical protein
MLSQDIQNHNVNIVQPVEDEPASRTRCSENEARLESLDISDRGIDHGVFSVC